MPGPNDTVVEQTIDHAAVLKKLNDRLDPRTRGVRIVELLRVNAAIKAVLSRTGIAPGAEGDLVQIGAGWLQHYANLDVYVGPAGAFEVHGDIRAKYNALGGAGGVLGFPVTDETGTPDGIGRFNHFDHGSIYWTPNTGPMAVEGAIRDRWASMGWERGWLGYPVADQFRLPGFGPQDHPKVAWCRFENGAIAQNAQTLDVALAADISNADLRGFLRARVDTMARAVNSDIGFHPQTDDMGTTGWGYGFWSSVPRQVGVRLYGFHDNGVLPDSEFTIELKLRFLLVWNASFTYPASVSLVAHLDYIKVHASGLGNGDLANGLKDGIYKAFYRGRPDPDHTEVPDGSVFITDIDTGADQHGDGAINVIDVLTTAQGGLQVLVPAGPIIPGGTYNGRQFLAQLAIDQLLGR